jgi:hypothetical protein
MRLICLIFLFFAISCGVKGKPLPPLEPPFIGNGKPTQSEANAKKKPSEVKKNEESK